MSLLSLLINLIKVRFFLFQFYWPKLLNNCQTVHRTERVFPSHLSRWDPAALHCSSLAWCQRVWSPAILLLSSLEVPAGSAAAAWRRPERFHEDWSLQSAAALGKLHHKTNIKRKKYYFLELRAFRNYFWLSGKCHYVYNNSVLWKSHLKPFLCLT